MKISRKIVIVITLLLTIYGAFYYSNHYVSSIEKAMEKSNIKYSEIFHIEKNIDYQLVFYGNNDILSVGVVKNTIMGYEWIFGFGSKMFNENEQKLRHAFSNLPTKKYGNDQELISLTFGVIYDKNIDKLQIKYKDQEPKETTIVETAKGTIWYCISDAPLNYDPSFVGIFNNGGVVFEKN